MVFYLSVFICVYSWFRILFNTETAEEGTEAAEFFYSVPFSVIFVDSVVKEIFNARKCKGIRHTPIYSGYPFFLLITS